MASCAFLCRALSFVLFLLLAEKNLIQTVLFQYILGCSTNSVMDSAATDEHPVLLTEALLNPMTYRKRIMLIIFKINEPATHVATQAACVYSFTATAERESVWDVKENLRYNTLDYDTQHMSTAEINKEETCVLPDGNFSTVGAERFRCVEVLLQESTRAINWYDHVPRDFGEHDKELTALSPSTMKFKVFASPV